MFHSNNAIDSEGWCTMYLLIIWIIAHLNVIHFEWANESVNRDRKLKRQKFWWITFAFSRKKLVNFTVFGLSLETKIFLNLISN